MPTRIALVIGLLLYFSIGLLAQESKPKVTVTTIPSGSEGNKPYIIDTIKNEEGVVQMSRTYPKAFFEYQGKAMDSIKFTIFSSAYRISSPNDFKYTAQPNEIIFYYGVDSTAHQRQRYFVLGDKVTKAFNKEDIEVITIVKFLEHDIYGIGPFSGMACAMALEDVLPKKKK